VDCAWECYIEASYFFLLLLFFVEKKVTKNATGKQYTGCFPEVP
jgi:hypothetical protein